MTDTDDGGFGVHFYPEDGRISLACRPDTFKLFRDFVAKELRDFPEIPIEQIKEIEILDESAAVADDSVATRALATGCIVAAGVVITLTVIGAFAVVHFLKGR